MVRWLDRLPCYAAGALAGACGAVFVGLALTRDGMPFLLWPGLISVASGMLLALGGFLDASGLQRALRTGSIVLLNTTLLLLIAEAACRIGGVNLGALSGERERFEKYPVCFRMPTQPLEEVFFTRPGPQSWTGRVLNTLLVNVKSTDQAYADEPQITVRYDKDGFRNPAGLADWDIAVAGDSFTESGYLPDEQMFTSVLAAQSGRRVKHLGVSYTGNFSHAAYLARFGKAASTRQSVLAFFEGNDVGDDAREHADLQTFRSAGTRPYREIGRETSLFRSLYGLVKNLHHVTLKPRGYANATWIHGDKKTPVSAYYAPPSSRSLTPAQRAALDAALDEWARVNRDLRLQPWLLYLPCERRVLHGALEFGPAAMSDVVSWTPTDLPAHIAALCSARGIRFIDSTPALMDSCGKGVPTHNTIYDTHLNREGSRIVGELLARSLTPPP